jgi:hypothetical protein
VNRAPLVKFLTYLGILSFAASSVYGQTVPAAPSQSSAQSPPPLTAPAGHPPVVFTPHYRPGDSLRYQISFRSQSSQLTGGAVSNPQGARDLTISVQITLRLEVLRPVVNSAPAPRVSSDTPDATGGERAPLRLRAVYEHVTPSLSGDTFDPQANLLLAQYRRLQGRAIEFQLGTHGEVQYISGLQEVLQDPRALDEARSWLQQLGASLAAPLQGTAPGQSWRKTEAVPGAAIAGMEINTVSTYLRDEPCQVEAPAGEQCAVMLMRYTLGQKPGTRNSTPDDFRRNGLVTSGAWNGHGESLVHVSLRTGRTVSVSQSGEEMMDLTIRHTNGGPPIRYGGHSTTESHMLLLNDSQSSR